MRNLRLHMTTLEDIALCALNPPVIQGMVRRRDERYWRAHIHTAVLPFPACRTGHGYPGRRYSGQPRQHPRRWHRPGQGTPYRLCRHGRRPSWEPRPGTGPLSCSAAWCGLRRGEIIGLRPARRRPGRRDGHRPDRTASSCSRTRQAFDAPPKTDAGKRTVSDPAARAAGPRRAYGASGPGLIACSSAAMASPMRGDAVRQAFARARRKADMPGFRFHDLRHTGQTLAASAGATLKDLMKRLGHSSPAAAQPVPARRRRPRR